MPWYMDELVKTEKFKELEETMASQFSCKAKFTRNACHVGTLKLKDSFGNVLSYSVSSCDCIPSCMNSKLSDIHPDDVRRVYIRFMKQAFPEYKNHFMQSLSSTKTIRERELCEISL